MKRILIALLLTPAIAQSQHTVTLTRDDANQRITITIDNKPFTALLWSPELRKPVLYPIIAPDGTTLTRNNPPLPGERSDHPHHIGLWFNYSNVNGFDFWNNSDAITPTLTPERRAHMGSIIQNEILSANSYANHASITTLSTWRTATNQDLLQQTSQYDITVLPNGDRQLDLEFTLNNNSGSDVVFKDDKDGMLGLRVAQFLESPTEKGGTYADANGIQTKVTGAPSPKATGIYLTSAGKKGDAAWGTRGTWCILAGKSNGHTETIAILDHPRNPGYPTYWHARGYGLFAANPLGVSNFSPKSPAMNFTIANGRHATFRYRLLFLSHSTTPEKIDADQTAYATEVH